MTQKDSRIKKQELRVRIQKAKTDFKHKHNSSVQPSRQAQEGLNKEMVTGSKTLEDSVMDISFAISLNQFYGRIACEVLSGGIILNTGAPQHCVLSPFLFSVYTNEMTLNLHNSKYRLFKYANDMALVGLFKKNDDVSDYFAQISKFQQWCVSSSELLNIGKKKESILSHADPLPLVLCTDCGTFYECGHS